MPQGLGEAVEAMHASTEAEAAVQLQTVYASTSTVQLQAPQPTVCICDWCACQHLLVREQLGATAIP